MKKWTLLFTLAILTVGWATAADTATDKGAKLSGNFKMDYDFNKDLVNGEDPVLDNVSWDTATFSWDQKMNDMLKTNLTLDLLAKPTTTAATDETTNELAYTTSYSLIKAAYFDWNLFQIVHLVGGLAPEAYGLAKYTKNSYLVGATIDLFLLEGTLQIGNDNLVKGDNDIFIIPQIKAKLGDFVQAGISTKMDLLAAKAAASGTEDVQDLDLDVFATMNLLNVLTAKTEVYCQNILADDINLVGYAEASADLALLIPGGNITVYNLLGNSKDTTHPELDADAEVNLGIRLAPGVVLTGALGATNVLDETKSFKDDWYGFFRMNWTPSVSF